MTSLETELLEVAVEAARAAAGELLARFGGQVAGIQAKSTPTDLVSDADLAAEAAIGKVLAERRPGDAIPSEEGGVTAGGSVQWVVDPLDGTVNFLFGIPVWAVSVACEDADGTIAGVVLDPSRGECFSATRSGPPKLNGTEIHGSDRSELATAMVATGFGYDAAVRARQAVVLTSVLPRVRDIRRAGAAAIDLCWCACGRYDAYYERGVHKWDAAAGGLIAARAGLEVRPLAGSAVDPPGLITAPPGLIDELLKLVEPGRVAP
jgi:myo-inositol-1(or 4)-monophosphatase